MKTTIFFWKTREQCGTFLSWMHLTDGKIDLTRNHEALRVFHDLKPDIRAAIMDQTSNTQAQMSLTERNAAKQPLGRQKKWPYHFSENINIFFSRPTPKTHRGNGPNRQALPVHWTCMAHENAGFLTHKWTVHPWMVASHSAFGKSSIIYRWLRNEIHKTSFEMHQDVSYTASNHPFDLHPSFPTPIRALPGSRRTFVLCRFPPVEDTWRYGCIWTLQSLFGLIDAIVRQALLNLSGHNHFWKLRRITLWKPVFELLLPISEGLGSNMSQLPRSQWMNLDLCSFESFWKITNVKGESTSEWLLVVFELKYKCICHFRQPQSQFEPKLCVSENLTQELSPEISPLHRVNSLNFKKTSRWHGYVFKPP